MFIHIAIARVEAISAIFLVVAMEAVAGTRGKQMVRQSHQRLG